MRNDPAWRASTSYVRVTVKALEERYLALQKLNGGDGPGNLSELIDTALVAWLK